MFKVRALLDRANESSLGMVGLLVEDEGVLRTTGIRGSQSGTVTESDFEDLLASNHARPVDGTEIASDERQLVALWLGDKFAAEAARRGIPVAPLPDQNAGRLIGGVFWAAPPRHVWRVLDSWAAQAFRRLVETGDEEVAKLMSWALPNRTESRAARWMIAKGDAGKARELDWASRLARDEGDPSATPSALEMKYRALVETTKSSRPQKVIGFSALANGGDKEIAQSIAKDRNMNSVSFGAWLKKRAKESGRQVDRRSLQLFGQQLIHDKGELSLCLDVLEAIPETLADQVLVIEGIRHIKVLEAMRALFGSERFFLTYVHRPENRRIELLKDENLSDAQVADVLRDPTEKELPSLRERANLTVAATGDLVADAKRITDYAWA
jgi:hypothetical protein